MRQILLSLAANLFRGLCRLQVGFRTRTSDLPPGKVLILAYMPALGYGVHMTPVFEAIKRLSPAPEITVATRGVYLDVLRHSPFVDHLIETPDPLTGGPAATMRTLWPKLRAQELVPDCCLTGSADQRTLIGMVAAAVCPGWLGGFAVVPQLYDRPLAYDPALSRMRNNLRLAELLGPVPVDDLEPRVFFSSADLAHARGLLAGLDRGHGILAVIPANSGGLPTAWLDERWAATVRHAQQELGYAVVFLGALRDAATIERIRDLAHGAGASLAGRTSVSQLAAVLALSDMVATIDTGGMHVTRAVGTPMVLLAHAWEPPTEWLATGREHIRILRGPDILTRDPAYRMQDLPVDRVCRELAEMQQLFPASQPAREARAAASLSNRDLQATQDQTRSN